MQKGHDDRPNIAEQFAAFESRDAVAARARARGRPLRARRAAWRPLRICYLVSDACVRCFIFNMAFSLAKSFRKSRNTRYLFNSPILTDIRSIF